MPLKSGRRRHSSAPVHHKHTKGYQKAYWPYLPMVFIVIGGLIMGQPPGRVLRPNPEGVLAYATNTSPGGLLSATNTQRSAAGVAGLANNAKLANAAQAKANDMVARNYWSHNTPDGQEPWIFVQNAGYSYLKAGENLAYGFTSSDDTVTGWMNSPTHKANLLDSGFSEVGFGMANSSNYNSSGAQTVVVAMYGKPQVLAASTTPAAPVVKAPSPAPAKSVATPKPAAPTPNPATTKPVSQPKSEVAKPAVAVLPVSEPASIPIAKAQLINQGNLPWLIGLISISTSLAVMVLLAKHGWHLHRLVRDSENFIMHHPLLDTVLVSVIMVGYVLSRTQGIIK